MDCSDRPVSDAVLANLHGCAADGLALLGLSADAPPAARVAAVDAFLVRWQAGERPAGVAADDVPYLLGSAWGQAVVDAVPGWAWAEVVFRRHADVPAVAVVSADRALALFPIHVVQQCATDPSAEVTVALAFDRLIGGDLDGLTPGGFANVTDLA